MKSVAMPLAAALIFSAGAGVSAQPIGDITGQWKGSGFVQKDEKANKMNVRCEVTGDQTGENLAFDGKCRAMLVLSRDIGADIVRQGDAYTGTYVGSLSGPAKLDGTRVSPDRIELEMTFQRVVNGDDKAVMTIETSGDNQFSIITRDRMNNGETITTSSVTFQRQ